MKRHQCEAMSPQRVAGLVSLSPPSTHCTFLQAFSRKWRWELQEQTLLDSCLTHTSVGLLWSWGESKLRALKNVKQKEMQHQSKGQFATQKEVPAAQVWSQPRSYASYYIVS